MKWLGILEILLVVAGFLLVYAAERYSLTFLVTPGIFLVGVGILVGGAEVLLRREVAFRVGEEQGSPGETFRGAAAVLWGVFFLVLGVGVLVFAAARPLGLEAAVGDFLKERPGAAILVGSLGSLGLGSALSLGSAEERSSLWAVVGSLPRRLFGIVLILLALVGVAVGLLEIVAPATFDRLLEAALGSLPRAPE